MLTFLTTAEARTRQMAAVRAARVAGAASWRGFGMNTGMSIGMSLVSGISRSVRGVFASICAARVSEETCNTNSYRHTNKFSSALVVPAPRVSTVLHT